MQGCLTDRKIHKVTSSFSSVAVSCTKLQYQCVLYIRELSPPEFTPVTASAVSSRVTFCLIYSENATERFSNTLIICAINTIKELHLKQLSLYCLLSIIPAKLPALHRSEPLLMNYTSNTGICHSKVLVNYFLGSHYVNLFPRFLTRSSFGASQTASIGQILVQTVVCCRQTPLSHCCFVPQIMRPVITILIGINKKWVMAQDTFANSTQRMEHQGIMHTWEGHYNLMKIQLAHFGNGLCTRNKISKIGWKIRASNQIAVPQTFPHTVSRLCSLS